MEREIADHKCPGCENVQVVAFDGPGPGGASHCYGIRLRTPEGRYSEAQRIHFQEGAIGEYGVNGVTNEALLAMVIDRLRGFQTVPFPCRENALALTHIETGLLWLKQRTTNRVARGVEGKTEA